MNNKFKIHSSDIGWHDCHFALGLQFTHSHNTQLTVINTNVTHCGWCSWRIQNSWVKGWLGHKKWRLTVKPCQRVARGLLYITRMLLFKLAYISISCKANVCTGSVISQNWPCCTSSSHSWFREMVSRETYEPITALHTHCCGRLRHHCHEVRQAPTHVVMSILFKLNLHGETKMGYVTNWPWVFNKWFDGAFHTIS